MTTPGEPFGSSDVTVRVPAGLRGQFVYRQVRERASGVAAIEGVDFVLLRCPLAGLRRMGALRRTYGAAGAVKGLLKLATGRRLLYGMWQGGELVHHGWLTLGGCRHYWTDPGAVVIGPINTLPAWRRRGLARVAMQMAMDAMFGEGRQVFFIDTSDDNTASRRTIAACGFGDPVAGYLRGPRVEEGSGDVVA